jgi:tetratricopeptide (TPR) repeat protein
VNALARLPDTPAHRRNRVHALIRLVHASAFADDPAHNLARLEEAEQLAQSLSAIDLTAREQLAQVYYWHGFFRLLSNDMRSTIRYYRQAYALAQQISDDQLTAQLALEFAIVLNVQGRFGEAEPLIAQSIALMRRAGKPLEDVIALAHWGIALAGRGDYAEGLKQASQSLARVQEINSVYGIEFNLVLLAWIHFLGGEMLPALQAAQQAVNLARTAGDWIHVFTGSVFVAWALSRMGQHSAAQDTVAQIQTLIEKTHGHLVGMQMFMAVHSEIALNANQIDEALRLAQSAVAAAQANDVVFAEGIAERVWAQGLQQQNAAWNEIEAHLAQSLAAFEKGAVKIEMARTHKLWGQLLQSRGDTNAGRQHLEQAAQQFQPAGLAMELAQVQDLMREAKRA